MLAGSHNFKGLKVKTWFNGWGWVIHYVYEGPHKDSRKSVSVCVCVTQSQPDSRGDMCQRQAQSSAADWD